MYGKTIPKRRNSTKHSLQGYIRKYYYFLSPKFIRTRRSPPQCWSEVPELQAPSLRKSYSIKDNFPGHKHKPTEGMDPLLPRAQNLYAKCLLPWHMVHGLWIQWQNHLSLTSTMDQNSCRCANIGRSSQYHCAKCNLAPLSSIAAATVLYGLVWTATRPLWPVTRQLLSIMF